MCRSSLISQPDLGYTYKFIGSMENCLEKDIVLKSQYDGTKREGWFLSNIIGNELYEYIQIPCGKCIGCRMDYSRSWADRMTYHVQGREEASYFLTLTYDDDSIESLVHSENYDLYALRFDDMTDFIKKLRNRFRDAEIDYYYSGEYGDNSFRPHFHMILYNIFIPDLEFWKLKFCLLNDIIFFFIGTFTLKNC